MISLRLYGLVLCGAGLAFAGYTMLRRKPKTAEELECERRTWLNTVGRITDGTVIDVQQLSEEGKHDATMLIYQYDVAGVSYEASQDVTYLRQWINLHSCRLGLPTSVKYDCRRLDWAAAVNLATPTFSAACYAVGCILTPLRGGSFWILFQRKCEN
jgi:hypothetical protein